MGHPQHQRSASSKIQHPPIQTDLQTLVSSATAASSGRSRRASNPSTPTLTPHSVSTATSPSYFSPQPQASGSEPRSPANRRPPASFSGHGIDNSRGPPITLITRGSYSSDIARRSQKPSDFAFAQQQLLQLGLVSPGGTKPSKTPKAPSSIASSSRGRERRDPSADRSESGLRPHNYSRRNSGRSDQMESSLDGSSDYDSGRRSQLGDTLNLRKQQRAGTASGADTDQGEDLFLNLAQDNSQENNENGLARVERRRSRIARAGNRSSLPANTYSSPSQPQSSSTTPNASKIPSAIDTKPAAQYRRSSHLPSPSFPSRNRRESSPMSPANIADTTPARSLTLSPQAAFSTKTRDQQNSPQLLPHYGRRRPSYPDASHTPLNRTHTYKPSNLQYTSSRDAEEVPVETPSEQANSRTYSRPDGTESVDSTGPPASVWDELDELKTRIRRIELSGKMPATSAAAVSNGSGDRPRTATTTVTTVSSSPKNLLKSSTSPSESTVGGHTAPNVHPLLHTALSKAKEHVAPPVYRVLEAAAKEALDLAALTGSAGPQGTLFSASSIINGATVPDRQVRRKADNLCRSLTELCIALCETKTSPMSPVFRSSAAESRRSSVQINGDSHTPTYGRDVRVSVEPEPERNSPSRALNRIEARRTSVLGLGRNQRETSQEPPTPSESAIPTRLNRAGTSLLRARRTAHDEDEDPTIRVPSRAMTEINRTNSNREKRFSREYTSREPMPDLQPSPSLQHSSSLRRNNGASDSAPTPTSASFNRRYLDRQTPERTLPTEHVSSEERRKTQLPVGHYSATARASAGTSGLGRTGSLTRQFRAAGVGD